MILESKLVTALTEKLDAEEKRQGDLIMSGNLTSLGEYGRAHGRIRALADCKILLTETYEELMKE